jgi:glyoxylase-like metal-dependent hydrolase (beta-lactamase superfamily II)
MESKEAVPMSRRRFLISAGAAGAAMSLPYGLFGRAPRDYWQARVRAEGPVEQIRRAAQTGPMTVQALRGNLSVVFGSGGNIGVVADKDGVLLVDSGIVGSRVAASVASVTPVPIRYLVNSHWHFDHTDANEWHATHGATIIAQESTRKHLSQSTRVDDWNFTFEASPAAALPTQVFAKDHVLQVDKTRLRLQKYAPAHTDSDISVHFEGEDVLHVADTWWNGIYPFIDYSTGGSIDGMIAATDLNIARTSAGTVIVPGHGAVGNRAQLIGYREMLVAVRERVAKLKRQGRTLDEVVQAKPTAAFDAAWDGTIISPDFFTRLVYKGV